MWRFLRRQRALRIYRTLLFKYMRLTYGRRLFYSPAEVRQSVVALGITDEFLGYALGMYCDEDSFDRFYAATGESCDYAAMRSAVVAHVAHLPVVRGAQFDAGRTHHGGYHDPI